MTEHLDLDALADVLDGEPAPTHLAGCAECSERLAALRDADGHIQAALRSLDEPPLPDGLADRLSAALAAEAEKPRAPSTSGSVTTLPAARPSRAARWLPAAAAAVLVLGGAAFGITQLTQSDSEGRDSGLSAAGGAEQAAAVVRNSTGTNYTGRPDLAAAVPGLLAGTAGDRFAAAPQALDASGGSAESDSAKSPTTTAGGGTARVTGVDPLARLRGEAGLADCLAALLPPDDPSVRPLALDYGAFQGRPALVVVLPSSSPKSLDVFVVGPGCSRANDSVLFYTSVPAS